MRLSRSCAAPARRESSRRYEAHDVVSVDAGEGLCHRRADLVPAPLTWSARVIKAINLNWAGAMPRGEALRRRRAQP
jgi:hypothetical protein